MGYAEDMALREPAEGLAEKTAQIMLSVTMKAPSLTSEILIKSFRKIIESKARKAEKVKHGEQSVKNLVKQNSELDVVPVSNIDVKKIKKQLKRCGVDFAVTKNRATGEFSLHFKAKDTSVIEDALKQVVHDFETSKDKDSKDNKKETFDEKVDRTEKIAKEQNEKTAAQKEQQRSSHNKTKKKEVVR